MGSDQACYANTGSYYGRSQPVGLQARAFKLFWQGKDSIEKQNI